MTEHLLDPYKGTIVNYLVQAAMGLLLTKAPWLSPVRFLLKPMLNFYLSKFLDRTIQAINKGIINIETENNIKKLTKLLDEIEGIPVENISKRDEIEKNIVDVSRDIINIRSKRL